MYQGDLQLGATIEWTFTTRRFTTGVPFTLAGSPSLEAYETGNTTPITAGITLTVNYSDVIGLNHVSLVASGANGFAANTDVSVVIAAGTVDSVSVVGETIGSFSIENRVVASVIDGVTIATGGITTLSFAAGALDAAAVSQDFLDAVSENLLAFDWAGFSGEADRSMLNALRFLRNRWVISAGTVTVYKENDSDSAWTGAVTQTAGNPVSQIDPAGP